MLLSMTGYGEGRYQSDALSLSIEVRALNNRYLKVSLRTSEPYQLLEPEFEKIIRRVIRRGTLQIHLRCERKAGPSDYRINEVALKSYLSQLRTIADEMKLGAHAGPLYSQLLTLPGVVREPVAETDKLHEDWPIIQKVLNEALDRLQQMRREEGQAMAQELLNYRQAVGQELEGIRRRIPEVASSYRERLFERVRAVLNELDVKLDRNDLIKEVSIYTERSDIAEEVIRLSSHLDQFEQIINDEDSPGRKLEFLTQEMFRETNTIGSKAADVEISRHVVEIKGTLERIRELVQNVE